MRKALAMKSSLLLLLLLAAEPHFTAGSAGVIESCRELDNFYFPPEDQTSFFSYSYGVTAGADGLECTSVEQTCYATVPNERLRQRVLYIDDFKSNLGFMYLPGWIQVQQIVCPEGNVLHIIPLRIDTEDSSDNAACESPTIADLVTISIPGQDPLNLCGTDVNIVEGYNNGFGVVALGGNATITFCSNINEIMNTDGFAIRATCVDPRQAFLPGCGNFDDKFENVENGRPFVNRINPDLIVTVEKANIPHKRCAECGYISESEAYNPGVWEERLRRSKRFASNSFFQVFTLDAGDSVTYSNSMLTITRADGTSTEQFTAPWLETFNSVVGTRTFDIESPSQLPLNGPGFLVVYSDGFAQLMYTLDDDDITRIVLPNSLESASRLNIISNYVYENYVRPYPYTLPPMNQSSLPPAQQAVPLPLAEVDDTRWRYVKNLNYIRADIQNGTCVRSVIPSIAPARFGGFIDRNIFDYCQHFYYSCNPLVAAVCADANRIAP